MKTLGLIGGTGWPSTVEYYRKINEGVNAKLGGLNFARCILFSFNYGEINELNRLKDMETLYKRLASAAETLEIAGAEGIILCANTLHQFAGRLADETDVPLIHIADATAEEIKNKGLSKVGLLGTKPTMEMDFYKAKLRQKGIDVFLPDEKARDFIHRAIMDELVKNVFLPETQHAFIRIIESFEQEGAQGVILGCTEIPLLIQQDDYPLPMFNTLEIHAEAAVNFALDLYHFS